MLEVELEDFMSESSYIKIQNDFMSFGSNFKDTELNDAIVAEDFHIQYKDEESGSLQERYFQNDFLILKIDGLGNKLINKFQNYIYENDLFMAEQKIELSKKYQLRCFSIEKFVKRSAFLIDEVKNALNREIRIALDFFETKFLLDIKNRDKIRFNLNRTDIQVLFLLLHQQKLIENPLFSPLGHLIDKYFAYLDENSNTFKEISKSGSLLSDFKNGSRTIEKSMQRLKEIFTSENFFEIQQ
ncbi:hypothetical protein [Altibacter sp. HG106]|uniref:hypothetical protein n=1 Tax=Altibacter sp. HG106 TaxID=3023937 RepID=UPI00235000AB|nr:hypothetical protein [Altibacter sp. HG106]MDC7994037.1 hypothetical protein [Altibacter sp. HG106]